MPLKNLDRTLPWGLGLALCVGLVISTPALAQPSEDETMAELRQLEKAYEQGLSNDNLDRLMPHLHPAFSGTMITGEYVDGHDEVRVYWKGIKDLIGEGGDYRVGVEPRDATLLGEGVALAHGTTDEHVETGAGQTFDFSGEWLALLEKQDGSWKIRNVHASMDPINNPFAAQIGRGERWLLIAAGAGGGLLVGGFGTWLWQRRRRKTTG